MQCQRIENKIKENLNTIITHQSIRICFFSQQNTIPTIFIYLKISFFLNSPIYKYSHKHTTHTYTTLINLYLYVII